MGGIFLSLPEWTVPLSDRMERTLASKADIGVTLGVTLGVTQAVISSAVQ
jgi:hypothetical protein